MTTPQRLTLDLPHLRFEALAWGPEEGRLMLCLHGYPDTPWTWRHLGPYFAEHGFRVVAPFMRGYAPTELARDGDYGIGALMYDAIALHEALGGGVDAVLVGHDWGGLAANGVAAYPGNPFKKVVSMGVPMLAGLQRGSGNLRELIQLLPRQLRMSWYVLFQQLPWISERTLDWVLPKLWRDWCPPGYDASADLVQVWQSLPTGTAAPPHCPTTGRDFGLCGTTGSTATILDTRWGRHRCYRCWSCTDPSTAPSTHASARSVRKCFPKGVATKSSTAQGISCISTSLRRSTDSSGLTWTLDR